MTGIATTLTPNPRFNNLIGIITTIALLYLSFFLNSSDLKQEFHQVQKSVDIDYVSLIDN